MQYIKVHWYHDFDDEPELLYSELDENHYETRKVEVFKNGRMTYADSVQTTGDTALGDIAVPAIDEIALQPDFEPHAIEKTEFESVWTKARGPAGSHQP